MEKNLFISRSVRKPQLMKKIKFNLTFIVLCIASGIGSALFSLATDQAYYWCIRVYKYLGWGMLTFTPLIFVVIAYLFKNYFSYAGGSGLPQGYALDVFDEEVLRSTYSIKTLIGKVILTFMSILGGASLGREGPTIQICASIFAMLKGITLDQKKLLIRIGSGVGVATAFNAPIGGIFFAIEEYIKHSNHRMNLLLLFGIAVAGYFSILISGNYSYMGYVKVTVLTYSYKAILLAILLGIICGLIGAFFTIAMVAVSVDKGSWFSKLRKQHYLITALFFGIIIAYLGNISYGYSFGNGSFMTKNILNGNLSVPWYFAISKVCGAILSVAAGVPGGYFSTALSIGAGIADIFHKILPVIPPQQYYLLGMVAFLAAITSAPITAVVMVISIVDGSMTFALPLVFASLIGSYIASLFGDSVYHQQVLIYIDKDKYHATR